MPIYAPWYRKKQSLCAVPYPKKPWLSMTLPPIPRFRLRYLVERASGAFNLAAVALFSVACLISPLAAQSHACGANMTKIAASIPVSVLKPQTVAFKGVKYYPHPVRKPLITSKRVK